MAVKLAPNPGSKRPTFTQRSARTEVSPTRRRMPCSSFSLGMLTAGSQGESVRSLLRPGSRGVRAAGKLLDTLREHISDGDWLGYLLPQLYCTLARCQAKAGRPDLAEGTYQDQCARWSLTGRGTHGPDPRPGRAAPAMTAAGPGQQGAVDVPWEKAKHPKRHGPGRSWGIPP